MSNKSRILHNLFLVCTDKQSYFYDCIGYAEYWLSDDHILFRSIGKKGGSAELSKDQFAVLQSSVDSLDEKIRDLEKQKEMLKEFKINVLEK